MKYTAKLGGYWKVQPFDLVPLKIEHTADILPANVVYKDSNTVYIYTDLEYEIGQKVSLGGYPINGKKFRMIELSVTKYPVLSGAEIVEKEEI